MATQVCCVQEHTPLPQVLSELQRHGVSAAPVLGDGGALVGLISLADLLQVGVVRKGARWQRPQLELPEQPAREIMTRNPLATTAAARVEQAVDHMLGERVHRLCVIEDGRLVGIFSLHDAMRAVADDRVPEPLAAVMTKSVATVRCVDPVEVALERLSTAGVHALVVTDGDLPIGVFGQIDALSAERGPAPSRVEDWYDPRLLCLPPAFPVHRAASQGVALHVGHIVVMDLVGITGIASASDLARSGLSPERQEALRPRGTLR